MPGLTVLYTARLAGALDRLPRLFSLIQRVRAGITGPSLLLDLGESCDPAVSECAATQGRAALFVLDAMGYDLACLTAAEGARLPAQAAQRLLERVSMGVCGAGHAVLPPAVTHTLAGLRVALVASPIEGLPSGGDVPPDVDVALLPAPALDAPRQEGALVWLPPIEGGQLGVLTLGEDGALAWRREAVLPVDRQDATVAAAVTFIRDEIRHYQRAQ